MPYEHVTSTLRARYGVSNRIASNRKKDQLIESIKFHVNDITRTMYMDIGLLRDAPQLAVQFDYIIEIHYIY